jgi:antitoxin (DNA-binding transcriptional repressor) of toxin-antitoxin stability system
MGNMSFLSFRELRTSTAKINEMLTNDGKIVVTNNGKPAAFMIAVNESTLEETLNNWQQVQGLRALKALQQQALQNGLSEMTLDEINAEIADSRRERRERDAQWETN